MKEKGKGKRKVILLFAERSVFPNVDSMEIQYYFGEKPNLNITEVVVDDSNECHPAITALNFARTLGYNRENHIYCWFRD